MNIVVRVIRNNEEQLIELNTAGKALFNLMTMGAPSYTDIKIPLDTTIPPEELKMLDFQDYCEEDADEEEEDLDGDGSDQMRTPVMSAEMAYTLLRRLEVKSNAQYAKALLKDLAMRAGRDQQEGNGDNAGQLSLIRDYTDYLMSFNVMKGVIRLAKAQGAEVQFIMNYIL
ncbi:MAG: hypothetical protein JO154_08305 [Chitinophaga sp.]|nr:hypothetical protein [Chitinophaga sp.]